MWGNTTLKKRGHPVTRRAPTRRENPAERVRSLLVGFGCGHLTARAQGDHIFIERGERGTVARVTPFGGDAFGLSFQADEGAWEPMLVDTLDAIVLGVTAVEAGMLAT